MMKITGTYLFIIWLLIILSCKWERTLDKLHTDLYYELSGSGTKTLVFIHGWCINHSYWDKQVPVFNKQMQVLNIDLPGHGKSGSRSESRDINAYASRLSSLLRQLNNDTLILVAHSMSGNIALHINEKLKGKIIYIVGIDNLQELGRIPTLQERSAVDLFMEELKKDYKHNVRPFAEQHLFSVATPSYVRKRVLKDISNANEEMAIQTLCSLRDEGRVEQQLAPMLKHKTYLMLSGYENPISYDSISLKKYLPNGYEVYSVFHTGHYPMIEDPDSFNIQLQTIINNITNHSGSLIN